MSNDKLMARGDAEVLLHNLEIGKFWLHAKVQANLPVAGHVIRGKVVEVGAGQSVTVAWENGYTTGAPMFLLEVIG